MMATHIWLTLRKSGCFIVRLCLLITSEVKSIKSHLHHCLSLNFFVHKEDRGSPQDLTLSTKNYRQLRIVKAGKVVFPRKKVKHKLFIYSISNVQPKTCIQATLYTMNRLWLRINVNICTCI